MDSKLSLEEQVRTLQRGMAGIVKMFKDLKITVEVIEKKVLPVENDEIQKILDTQKVIEEIMGANADAIKRIDRELRDLSKKEAVISQEKDSLEKACSDVLEGVKKSKRKKCRFFNRGYCKYESKCRFIHQTEICREHLEDNN